MYLQQDHKLTTYLKEADLKIIPSMLQFKLKTTNVKHEATRRTTIDSIPAKGVSNRYQSQLITKHCWMAHWHWSAALSSFYTRGPDELYLPNPGGGRYLETQERERERRTRTYTPLHRMFTVQ